MNAGDVGCGSEGDALAIRGTGDVVERGLEPEHHPSLLLHSVALLGYRLALRFARRSYAVVEAGDEHPAIPITKAPERVDQSPSGARRHRRER